MSADVKQSLSDGPVMTVSEACLHICGEDDPVKALARFNHLRHKAAARDALLRWATEYRKGPATTQTHTSIRARESHDRQRRQDHGASAMTHDFDALKAAREILESMSNVHTSLKRRESIAEEAMSRAEQELNDIRKIKGYLEHSITEQRERITALESAVAGT